MKTARRALYVIVLANIIHFGLGGTISSIGIAFTSATNAGFLLKLAFVFTLILAHLFLSESFTKTKIFAATIMLIGAYFLATEGRSITPNTGDVFILIACICWASGNVITKAIMKTTEVSGEFVTMLRPFLGAPLLIAFCLLIPSFSDQTNQVFGTEILNTEFTFYSALSGAFTILLWVFLNRTLVFATASYMTMMSMMTPVIVAFLGYSFLNETLSFIQMLGCALIIIAGVVTHYMSDEEAASV